ncbi:hypothetical protein BDQ17DRAFT_287977 [Cyathus striatus]|nr:hypothetical protein BDQ17DRAFT_287977 [Cyathus striatus]
MRFPFHLISLFCLYLTHPARSTTHSLFLPHTQPTLHTQPHVPHPTPSFDPAQTDPPPPRPPFHPHPHHGHPQKPITIVFEVLGGAVGLAFLLGFLRCCYVYQRTPKRDRIAAVLSRHQLERELQELERNPTALRRRSFILDPAPPYFPPPPAYATQPTTIPSNNNRTEYVDGPTSTASPSSPPSSSAPLVHPSTPLEQSTTIHPPPLPPNG